MIKKRYKMYDVGSPYLTHCGVKSDDDYFDNMTECCEEMNRLADENVQLKQQLQIFEKFLEGNDLSIDWEEFCGLEECAFENPNFSCKTCIHLKGDV